MKLAISVCEGRVSNVFDFAQKAVVVELRDATELDRAEVVVSGQGPARMARLRQLGVDTLTAVRSLGRLPRRPRFLGSGCCPT